MKKTLWGAILCLLVSAALLAQPYNSRAGQKFSISLFGGLSLASTKGTSQYSDSWNGQIAKNIEESADISYQADNGVFFGTALTFMFNDNLGLQLGGGIFSTGIPNDTAASWSYHVGTTIYDNRYAFSGQGRLRTIPIFMDLTGRFSSGLVDFNLFAGPAMFLNTTQAEATGLYGDNYWAIIYGWLVEWVDFFPLDMEIPSTSWTAFGFNAGGSADISLSPQVALSLEVRYFFCPEKKFNWEYLPGLYGGLEGNLPVFEIFPDEADGAAENTTPCAVNPSFLYIGGGFKIRL
jgi:opacity protein-like surface antigen